MSRNRVRCERNFVASRQIFYRVAARIALLCAYRDDERDFHFVGLAYLIAYSLSREIDGHRDIFSAQILRDTDGVAGGLFIHDAEHELCRRSILRHKPAHFEEVPCGHIAHTKADCGNFLAPELREERIVSSTTEERAIIFFVRVKNLKDHAGVVIKPT